MSVGLVGPWELMAGLHGRETEVSLKLWLVLSALCYPWGKKRGIASSDVCFGTIQSSPRFPLLQPVGPAARSA